MPLRELIQAQILIVKRYSGRVPAMGVEMHRRREATAVAAMVLGIILMFFLSGPAKAGTISGTPSAEVATVSMASPAPHAHLISPANGAKVAMVVKARGTASHLKGKLWLVVYSPVVKRYYPQPGPVTVSRTGKWSGTVYFGTAATRGGEPYTLLAVQASPAASAAMKHYLAVGNRTGSWPGMAAMPRGSLRLASVRVTRK